MEAAFQLMVLEILLKLIMNAEKYHQILIHNAKLSRKHLIGRSFIFLQ